jgi:hypothetical protein
VHLHKPVAVGNVLKNDNAPRVRANDNVILLPSRQTHRQESAYLAKHLNRQYCLHATSVVGPQQLEYFAFANDNLLCLGAREVPVHSKMHARRRLQRQRIQEHCSAQSTTVSRIWPHAVTKQHRRNTQIHANRDWLVTKRICQHVDSEIRSRTVVSNSSTSYCSLTHNKTAKKNHTHTHSQLNFSDSLFPSRARRARQTHNTREMTEEDDVALLSMVAQVRLLLERSGILVKKISATSSPGSPLLSTRSRSSSTASVSSSLASAAAALAAALPSASALAEMTEKELVDQMLEHKNPVHQRAGANEFERRLRSATPAEQEAIAAKMRDARVFHSLVSMLRTSESDVENQLAASRAIAAAASTSAATRDKIRYVGGVAALVGRCDVRSGSDDRVRLACLRALASMVTEHSSRIALRRADGLARLIRLFGSEIALPIQLLACAIVAQMATGSAGEASDDAAASATAEKHENMIDAFAHDAIADVVVLLLQRSDDERIVAHGLKLLAALSKSVALANRAADADDGRSVRALLHFCQRFLNAPKLYASMASAQSAAAAAATAGAPPSAQATIEARALANSKRQQTLALQIVGGFARSDKLCATLAPCVSSVTAFLAPPAGTTDASFAWDAAVLSAALTAVQMLCVCDATRGALLEARERARGTLVRLASMPRAFAPAVAAGAVRCLHVLWRLQPDVTVDGSEARAVVDLLKRSERHLDAASAAVDALGAIANDAVTPDVVELLYAVATGAQGADGGDNAFATLAVRVEAARGLRRLARASSVRATIGKVGAVSALVVVRDMTTASGDERTRLVTALLQLAVQLVQDERTGAALLADAGAVGVLVAHLAVTDAPLRRAASGVIAGALRSAGSATALVDALVRAGLLDALLVIISAGTTTTTTATTGGAGGGGGGGKRRAKQSVSLDVDGNEQMAALQLLSSLVSSPSARAQLRVESRLALLRSLTAVESALGKLAQSVLSSISVDDVALRAALDASRTKLPSAPPVDTGLSNPTVAKIVDKLSRDNLIALLDVVARLGRVSVKDALVVWRNELTCVWWRVA